MYTYRWLRDAGCWTVFEDGEPVSDHDNEAQCKAEINRLNGIPDHTAEIASLRATIAILSTRISALEYRADGVNQELHPEDPARLFADGR